MAPSVLIAFFGLAVAVVLAASAEAFPVLGAFAAGALFIVGIIALFALQSGHSFDFPLPSIFPNRHAARLSRATRHAANSSEGELRTRDDLAVLENLAKTDSLTGLTNRSQFIEVVSNYLIDAQPGSPHAILFIDMNGFKKVNDSLGHAIGDQLLVACADKLRKAVELGTAASEGEASRRVEIARFGGDEFTIFLGDGGSGSVAQRLAKRIHRVLSDPIVLGNKSVTIGASIGIAFAPDHGTTCDELISKADAAMYSAKRAGRNHFEVFSDQLFERAKLQEREEIEVREAFERGEMELYFQPLFDARTMEIISAEALVRWRHPTRGLISPGEFLPVMARCNMSAEFSRWVIHETTRRIAQLERSGTPLMIAANVSPSDLANVEFPSLVRSCVSRWSCSPHLLQLEITEDIAMRDPVMTARSLDQMKDIGVSVAIDDFGTGYSNLANLITLPISRLKIDRSLLEKVEGSPDAFVLVQGIISLANSLGFHSVAEGVETETQQSILQSMGCDVLQGFLLSRPITFDKLRLLCGNFAKINPRQLTAGDSDLERSIEAA
ncbi:MAG: bifunctional diguanylate cyclase/phosphodiesterase [Pseudomonadota bacterium]|nr:bifunctional diguanylate cyclase/phosphodiesterase [Pseudomonadota bacterium]